MDYYVTKTNLAQKTNEWLNRIASFNTHKLALNPSKSALLVIDMQKFFLDLESPTFTCGGLAIIDLQIFTRHQMSGRHPMSFCKGSRTRVIRSSHQIIYYLLRANNYPPLHKFCFIVTINV